LHLTEEFWAALVIYDFNEFDEFFGIGQLLLNKTSFLQSLCEDLYHSYILAGIYFVLAVLVVSFFFLQNSSKKNVQKHSQENIQYSCIIIHYIPIFIANTAKSNFTLHALQIINIDGTQL